MLFFFDRDHVKYTVYVYIEQKSPAGMLEGTSKSRKCGADGIDNNCDILQKRNNTKSRHHNYGDDKRCIPYMHIIR